MVVVKQKMLKTDNSENDFISIKLFLIPKFALTDLNRKRYSFFGFSPICNAYGIEDSS